MHGGAGVNLAIQIGHYACYYYIYIYIYIYKIIYIYIYMTCSNEMSHMSANLISRKHYKHCTVIFNNFDFSSPNHTLMSFLSTVNANLSFIYLSNLYYLFRKAM